MTAPVLPPLDVSTAADAGELTRVPIAMGERSYDIYIGADTWRNESVWHGLPQAQTALIVTNTVVGPLYTAQLKAAIDGVYARVVVLELPDGEATKDWVHLQRIFDVLLDEHADRKTVLFALGGGVIGDMGGFCASTFKRGVDFIQMPTTLLSQVDASIGGKLGIDFQQIKNSIGVFNNPKAVYANFDFLKTLPAREIRSGFAEIIKHALIRDASQWKAIIEIQDLTTIDWSTYLVPSLKIKKEIVEIDPFEKGLRKALNFGHTIGHAIESHLLETDNRLLHGEAIAIGMICESYLSQKVGLSKEELKEIETFLLRIYGKVKLPMDAFDEMLNVMRQDKKNIGNQINFTLLEASGKGIVNQTATIEEIAEAMNYYNSIVS